jgi:hypothetical protein
VSNRPRFTKHSGHTEIPLGIGPLDPRQTAAFHVAIEAYRKQLIVVW